MHLAPRKKKSISQLAAQSLITGPWKPPLKHINPKETTSSQPKSSIMQSFTPANILRKSAERRSHILM
jgi:FeS_nifS: cysteine desulfurase NifS